MNHTGTNFGPPNKLYVALVISLFGKSHVRLKLSTYLKRRLFEYILESLQVRFILIYIDKIYLESSQSKTRE